MPQDTESRLFPNKIFVRRDRDSEDEIFITAKEAADLIAVGEEGVVAEYTLSRPRRYKCSSALVELPL